MTTTLQPAQTLPEQIQAATLATQQAIHKISADLSAHSKAVTALADELLRLAQADPDAMDEGQAYSHKKAIERTLSAFVDSVNALSAPHNAGDAWSVPYPALATLAAPYAERHKEQEQERQAETERQERARVFAEEEMFEEGLRARARAGEAIDFDAERAGRRRQQEKQAATAALWGTNRPSQQARRF